MNQTLTPERLAGFFDHTLLKPYATKKDFENFCNNCKQYRFAMAAVNPSAVRFLISRLVLSPQVFTTSWGSTERNGAI